MLKEKEIKEKCMLNKGGKQCRYLCKIEGSSSYLCLKQTGYKIIIDSVLKENSKNKKTPVGDNCCGIMHQPPESVI